MSLLKQSVSDNRADQIRKVAIAGLILNIVLASIKLAAGIAGRSQALVADAMHSLTDVATDLSILIGVRYWSAPADSHHPHGHGRIETAVAAGIGLVLAVTAFGIAYHGVLSLLQPRSEPIGLVALGAALISIVSKELIYRWTVRVGRKAKSQALLANAWHHRSDAISSLPAAVAVAGATLWPALIILDSIGAIVVAVFILQAAWRIVRPAVAQLVDESAPKEVNNQIASLVISTPGVQGASNIRTRHIGGGVQVDLCIQVDPEMTVRAGHEISEAVVENLLQHGPDILDAVVHLEPWEPSQIGRKA